MRNHDFVSDGFLARASAERLGNSRKSGWLFDLWTHAIG
jgi:hypothetical protein